MLILVAFMALDSLLGKRLPTSFLPEEDYGYAFLNVQLPAAASLSRTDEVLRKIEKIIAQSEGVRYLGLKIRCVKIADRVKDLSLDIWRQVDATTGRAMGTCRNLWNAEDLSDGCFVEFKLIDRNVW